MSKTQGKTAKPSRRPTRPQPQAPPATKPPESDSPMPGPGAAYKNMQDQRRITEGDCDHNLSAMFRACGQPPGKDPCSFTQRAVSIIHAIYRSHANTGGGYYHQQPIQVLLLSGEDLYEFAATGDYETPHVEIALLYALYVDGTLPV